MSYCISCMAMIRFALHWCQSLCDAHVVFVAVAHECQKLPEVELAQCQVPLTPAFPLSPCTSATWIQCSIPIHALEISHVASRL